MRVDVSGLACPQPVGVVRRHLEGLDAGDELVVVGDSGATEGSVRRACEGHGYDVQSGPPTDDGQFSLRIRVTEFSTL
ncbi:MAG: sulfurtransferase TusA family protein [Halapricum sp.]